MEKINDKALDWEFLKKNKLILNLETAKKLIKDGKWKGEKSDNIKINSKLAVFFDYEGLFDCLNNLTKDDLLKYFNLEEFNGLIKTFKNHDREIPDVIKRSREVMEINELKLNIKKSEQERKAKRIENIKNKFKLFSVLLALVIPLLIWIAAIAAVCYVIIHFAIKFW